MLPLHTPDIGQRLSSMRTICRDMDCFYLEQLSKEGNFTKYQPVYDKYKWPKSETRYGCIYDNTNPSPPPPKKKFKKSFSPFLKSLARLSEYWDVIKWPQSSTSMTGTSYSDLAKLQQHTQQHGKQFPFPLCSPSHSCKNSEATVIWPEIRPIR